MKIEPVITLKNSDSSVVDSKKSIKKIDLLLEGNVKSLDFQIIKKLLSSAAGKIQLNCQPQFPSVWDSNISALRHNNSFKLQQNCQFIIRDVTTGSIVSHSLNDFQNWAAENHILKGDFQEEIKSINEDLVINEFSNFCRNTGRPIAVLGISVNGGKQGELLFELYKDICPKTVENFIEILKGTHQSTINSKKVISYIDTAIHRIVKNAWIQGGDTGLGLGDEGESIYGSVFEDENFVVKHDKRGILSMVNRGPHSNNSQFMITLKCQPSFDKKYVAFGRLIDGHDLLARLESLEVNDYERPVSEVKIVYGKIID